MAHRLQAAIPELDFIFQKHYRRRTHGQRIVHLGKLDPKYKGRKEYARDGKFYRAYMGRMYGSDGAAEMISMLFQPLLGKPNMGLNKKGELVIMENTKRLEELIALDKESFRLALGILINYKPK